MIQPFDAARKHQIPDRARCNSHLQTQTCPKRDFDLIPKDGGLSSKMIVVVGTIKDAGHCLGFCAGEINMLFPLVSVSMHSEEVEIPLEFRSDMQPGGIRLTQICALSSAISAAFKLWSSFRFYFHSTSIFDERCMF